MAFFVSNPLLSGLVPEHETLIYKLIWIAATSCTMLIAGLRDRADRRHAPLRLDPAVLHLMSARAPKVLRQASLPHGAPLDPQPLGRLVDGSYRSWLSTATKATSAPMQATRRRTQVARDLQLSSIASGRRGAAAASEEAGGVANPSPPPTAGRGRGRPGRARGGRNRNGIPPWAWLSGRDWGRGLGI